MKFDRYRSKQSRKRRMAKYDGDYTFGLGYDGAGQGGSGGTPTPNITTPSTFTATQLADANRIYQRDTTSGGALGKGAGTIPVTINPTVIGQCFARLRDVTTDQVIGYSDVITISATGSQVKNFTGLPAGKYWAYLDLTGDGSTFINGTTAINVGLLVGGSGQSLAVRWWKKDTSETAVTLASLGLTPDPFGRVFATTDATTTPTAWNQFADGSNWDSAGGLTFVKNLIAMAGVNVGFIGLAIGSTMLSTWQSGQTNGNALLATLAAAGGKFEIFYEMIGHSDSVNSTAATAFKAGLTSFFNSITAANAFTGYQKLLSTIPTMSNSATWGKNWQKEALRRAGYDWAQANGAQYLSMTDIRLVSDNTHESQLGSVDLLGRHATRALRPYFGLAHNDNGTMLGQPTKSGTRITFPYTLASGATTLVVTGDPTACFKVYAGGDRFSPLAITAASFSFDNTAKTLGFDLASDPGNVPLTILPAGASTTNPDGSANNIFDDLTDSDGNPLGRLFQFTPTAWKIAGATRNLTPGGTPAYSATAKFGANSFLSGYGSLPTPPTPGLGTGLTHECWVYVGVVDSVNTQTILGCVAGIQMSVIGNDLLIQGDTSTSPQRRYANTLPTNTWVHVALVVDSPSYNLQLFVNGVLNGTVAGLFNQDALVINNTWGLKRLGATATNPAIDGQFLVDEVALFEGAKYSANFTPPTSAYNGNEPGLIALYHLDGNLNNSCSNVA